MASTEPEKAIVDSGRGKESELDDVVVSEDFAVEWRRYISPPQGHKFDPPRVCFVKTDRARKVGQTSSEFTSLYRSEGAKR